MGQQIKSSTWHKNPSAAVFEVARANDISTSGLESALTRPNSRPMSKPMTWWRPYWLRSSEPLTSPSNGKSGAPTIGLS